VRRSKYNQDEIMHVLKEFQSSGCGLREFSAKKNIPYTTIYTWTRKFPKKESRLQKRETVRTSSQKFLPVELNLEHKQVQPRLDAKSESLVIEAGRLRLFFNSQSNPSWVVAVLRGLQ
jgi:hypothetical protein